MSVNNKVTLIGNIGETPEIVTLENGKKLAKFPLATNEVWKNAEGEKQQKTQWHDVVAWGKIADVIEQYFTKGKEIALEGKLTYNTWEDEDGKKRKSAQVELSDFHFTQSK